MTRTRTKRKIPKRITTYREQGNNQIAIIISFLDSSVDLAFGKTCHKFKASNEIDAYPLALDLFLKVSGYSKINPFHSFHFIAMYSNTKCPQTDRQTESLVEELRS